jgi:hypothetical protein
MGIKTKLVASVLLAQMLAGCSFSGFALRDDYWGKQILEQALFIRSIAHDGLGAPVLKTTDDLLTPPLDPDKDEGA